MPTSRLGGNKDRLKRVFLCTLNQGENYPPYDTGFMTISYGRACGLGEIRDVWQRTLSAMQAGKAPRSLGLYVHWPFCRSKCSFCFCDFYVPRSYDDVRLYIQSLKREAEAFQDVFRGASFNSVNFGGGTPSFISAGDLDGLLSHLRSCFTIESSAQIHFEVSPSTMSPGKLAVFLRHGVNRVTMGVQSTDENVLAAVNRQAQSLEGVERACRMLIASGKIVVDVDLMAGLEGQTAQSFVRDLSRIIRMGPDMVHVYGFDPRSHTAFSRSGKRLSLDQEGRTRALMEISDRIMRLKGYSRTNADSPDPENEQIEDRQNVLLRKRSASMLGLGRSALSHAFGGGWYQHAPGGERPVTNAEIPAFRLVESGLIEECRGYAIRNLGLYGWFARRDFHSLFKRDVLSVPGLSRALGKLNDNGGVVITEDAIRLKPGKAIERELALKSLYGGDIVRRVLNSHKREYAAFLEEYSQADDIRLHELLEGSTNKFPSRTYRKTKPASAAPTPSSITGSRAGLPPAGTCREDASRTSSAPRLEVH